MRYAILALLFVPLSASASPQGAGEPARRGGGWIPGTNPPTWSDSWMPPPAEPWIKPLVEPFSDWNVDHWDLPTPKKGAGQFDADADAVAAFAFAKAARERVKTTPAPAPVGGALPVPQTGYPLRGALWSHPGEIHDHLINAKEHRGKWDAGWIRSLTAAEAESLHSDDHEGIVHWQYLTGHGGRAGTVVNGPATPVPPLTTYADVVAKAGTATSRRPVHFTSGLYVVPPWAPKDTVYLAVPIPGDYPAGVYRAWRQGEQVVFQRMYPPQREGDGDEPEPTPAAPPPATFTLPTFQVGGSSCPNGNCPSSGPTVRRGLFGWR